MSSKKALEAEFRKDLTENMESVLSANKLLTVDEAMKLVQETMLASNPFVPPTGSRCPINHLPNELLAHIFYVGAFYEDEEEEQEEEEEEEDALDLAEGWDTESEDGHCRVQVQMGDDGAVETMLVDCDHGSDGGSSTTSSLNSVDEVELPFQVLVSHVCQHWRQVALSTPSLWTEISFNFPPFEQARVWIERSKGLPLNITIDCTRTRDTGPDDEEMGSEPDTFPEEEEEEEETPYFTKPNVETILDIITPHSARWLSLEIQVLNYKYMHLILSRLAELPPALLLRTLQLYHYNEEDLDPFTTFRPKRFKFPFFIPFQGQTPQLEELALWGVHIGWTVGAPGDTPNNSPNGAMVVEQPQSIFRSAHGLRELELAYHVSDVRPPFTTFAAILCSCANLQTLSLCASGPAGQPGDWPDEVIKLNALKELVLCYHEPEYITALIQRLNMPQLIGLTLDFDSADYSMFVRQLAGPASLVTDSNLKNRDKRSILAGLEKLKISALPCDNHSIDLMLGQLVNLRCLHLNCSGEVEVFFDKLAKPIDTEKAHSSNPPLDEKIKLHCPVLETLATTGITGSQMRSFIELRKSAGLPLKKVLMGNEDFVEQRDLRWLNEHVKEGVEFFEPSDEEDELETDEEEEEE